MYPVFAGYERNKVIYLTFEFQCLTPMRFTDIIKLVCGLWLLIPFSVLAQISERGTPVRINKLKSAISVSDLVILPEINNAEMRSRTKRDSGNQIKSLHFAHPFSVSLSPKNSGKWYSDVDLNVWQLRVLSSGAYSLNFILEQFNLPENARLYLINEKTGEIKGAYTSLNNSEKRILAIEPIAGDEILIQYEEPVNVTFPGEFKLVQISHDFVGVTAAGPHRPLGISGSCNVNINCDLANGTEEIRDAVCRIIIEGTELCTGTFLNNTSFDGIPYLITAYHCISTEKKAQSSVFLFNYESPYCTSIDGDVSRSLSGSSIKASFDSLDFSLVRLNVLPPYSYRPYLAGWNRKNTAPLNTISIHHPLGDIKKIAVDKDMAVTNKFSSNYLLKGFWNVLRWDLGVTEQGSSGGPLFDQNRQLIGTLTGGAATCTMPTNDYFEKFALAWDYRKESTKQLKFWLDPSNTNTEKLQGMYMYPKPNLCTAVTNIKDNETHVASQISTGLTKKGYWTGSNLAGYTEFAEQYTFAKSCEIQGVTLGVAKVKINPLFANSYINVLVYEGNTKPENLVYSEKYNIKSFWIDGMNYLPFKTPVKTSGNFFVAYNLSELNSGDTLAIYMANRKTEQNSFFLKNQSGWLSYNSQNLNGYGTALLTELVACNVNPVSGSGSIVQETNATKFYPNPLIKNTILTVESRSKIECPEEILVTDLLGRKHFIPLVQVGDHSIRLNFNGQKHGVYFVTIESEGVQTVGKIVYMP